MCGIAGIISRELRDKEKVIKRMTDIIVHRGPDDAGFYCRDNVALGMRRLSIIDIEGGHQPIVSDDGNFVIIFNGEIYNFKELRDELKKEGYNFNTKTDTEVVLKLYEKEKEKMLSRLRGMFAFCIYDKGKKEIFLARDYFGIKPLYYLRQNNFFAFGSEIKSFIGLPGFKPEVNDKGFYRYLSYQYVPGKETMFKGVFRLPAGSFMKINSETGEIKTEQKYWSFNFNQKNQPEKELKKELLEAFRNSVRVHMIADVPVGAFLSGGVDSAAISALMQETLKDKKISTFSIGFEEVNEFEDSRRIADEIKSDHTEIKISSKEYFDELPKLVWHFDEPVGDPSAIALYFVAREAAKKVKVVLSGEGADELFGGYNIYLEPFALKWLGIIPKILREKILRPLAKSDFNFFGKNYLKRYFIPLEERFIGNANVFKENELERIWKGKNFGRQSGETERYYKETAGLGDSTRMQHIDINFWLIGDILAKADKMTMANSLELRVPFLDARVADLASQIPDRLKFRKGATKYILRQSLKGIIPEQNRNKKKLGFPVPIKEWIRSGNTEILDTIKNNQYIKEHLDSSEISRIFSEHLSGKADNARKIYLLLIFSIWHKIFIKD